MGNEWVKPGVIVRYKSQLTPGALGETFVVYEIEDTATVSHEGTPSSFRNVRLQDLQGNDERWFPLQRFDKRFAHVEPPPATDRYERLLEDEDVTDASR